MDLHLDVDLPAPALPHRLTFVSWDWDGFLLESNIVTNTLAVALSPIVCFVFLNRR